MQPAFFAQQQTLQTNFLFHQVVYNPAYMGVVPGKAFNIGYRNQWTGFEGAPRSVLLSGYGNMRKKPIAVGALITSDRLGLIDQTAGYLMFAYHLQLNKNAAVNFGLGAGAMQYSVRMFEARPYDKDDNFIVSEFLNGYAIDANAGLYFYAKDFFLGLSDQHMAGSRIRWSNGLGTLSPHYYLYSGYNFRLGKKKEYLVQPAALVRVNQPVPNQYEMWLKLMYREKIWIGGSYRYQSSASAFVGFLVSKQFQLAYAYDLSLNALSLYNTGSHEILLSYLIPQKKKRSRSEQIQDADEEELNNIDNTIKTSIKAKKTEAENAPKEQEKKKE